MREEDLERERLRAEQRKHKLHLHDEIERLKRDCLESDCEEAYPDLKKEPGTFTLQHVKKVLSVCYDEISPDYKEVYYLCSWV